MPEIVEDPEDHLGLGRFDHHPVTVGPWPTSSIDPHLADRNGLVAVRRFADRESPRLLPLLAAQGLLAEVVQVELVDDAAHLEPELGVVVVAVEAIRSRDDAHAVEAELGVERQEEVVVARQAREIVDEHDLELPSTGCGQQCFETGAVPEGAGLRLVLI
ncbi:MAG TPA: hypothetical protein VFE48_23605 [Methylomirabilota bacterium]|nr:hypothetical protein [Methylomirabilota bacterium]